VGPEIAVKTAFSHDCIGKKQFMTAHNKGVYMQYLATIIKGFIIGIANVIPGVSGGTMALVVGIYERTLRAVGGFSLESVKNLCGIIRLNQNAREAFVQEFRERDILFLALLGAGAVVSIWIFAGVMVYLLETFHDPTYGFFFGGIVASLIVPYKLIQHHNWKVFTAVLVAAAFLVALTASVNEDEIISRETVKYEQALAKITATDIDESKKSAVMDEIDYRTVYGATMLFVSGVISMAAMILPGISGSFCLLLMGMYFPIMRAVHDFNIPVLVIFTLGILAGTVLCTKLIGWLLKKAYDVTMGFLLGLVFGSLWVIWPFKHTVLVGRADSVLGQKTVYLGNTLPVVDFNLGVTIILAVAGIAVVVVMLRIEKHFKKD
jgi:putative membrane protein